ncbi:MAG: hypothetical protein F4Z72_05170 [Gemmatimonadales bacterium]|nr:hypothetical protein [Candidatus Palauibacter irciniicola]MYC17082.1 hypothetical protein [Gemmatimonadales bacterium]
MADLTTLLKSLQAPPLPRLFAIEYDPEVSMALEGDGTATLALYERIIWWQHHGLSDDKILIIVPLLSHQRPRRIAVKPRLVDEATVRVELVWDPLAY